MDDLISIIVPVYNVEKYLKKSIDSIISQTFKKIEIILIDDGSTDSSGKLCDELAKTDKRIKVFHKKNGGASDARNYGLDKSKGKYVCFVDSDDIVTNDMCEILYNDMVEFNADVVFCSFTDCYGNFSNIVNENVERKIISKEEAIEYVMIGEKVPIGVVAKLYRKSIFNKVRFENGRTYEDALIMIELLDNCKIISYNSSSVYYYIHRENSVSTQNFSKKNYDAIYVYEKNYRIIEKKYPKLLDVAQMRLCWANFQVLDSMVRSNVELDNNIIRYLRSKFWFILKCSSITKSRKLSMVVLKISKKMYIKMAKKFYAKKRVNYK